MFDDNEKKDQEPEIDKEYNYVFNKEPEKKISKKSLIVPYLLSIISICLCVYLYFNPNTVEDRVVLYENSPVTTGDLGYDSTVEDNDTNNTRRVNSIANTKDSVVEIQCQVTTQTIFGTSTGTSSGSGVILSDDGYIVTNNHVIDDASKIAVTLNDGDSYEAKIIGADSSNDLAVIKIDAKNLSPAILGDSTKLKLGESVYAIGNPLGTLGGTVTDGIVSATSRYITIEDNEFLCIQIDAAVSPGNSGGGLFNYDGELIGIVNAKSEATGAESIGFAIPISEAKSVIQDLIKYGSVKRPAIGISVVEINTEEERKFNDVDDYGVYISSVSLTSDAKLQGLKVGDRITEIDGKAINTRTDITSILNEKQVGDTIKMTIDRDNQYLTFTVKLKESTN